MAARPLAEGAIMAAITVLLCLAFVYVPVVGVIGQLLCPLPVTLMVMRYNWRLGLLAAVSSTIILMIFAGPLNAFFMASIFGGLGLVFGYCFQKGFSAGKTILWGLAAAVFIVIANLFFVMGLSGVSFAGLWHEVELMFDTYIATMKANPAVTKMIPAGMTAEQFFAAYRATLLAGLKNLLPAILLIAAALISICNYFISGIVLHKLGQPIKKFTSFGEWHISPWFSWAFVAALALGAVGNLTGNPVIGVVGNNCMYIIASVLCCAGLAVMAGMRHILKTGIWFTLLSFLILLFYPAAFFITYVFMGLLDPLFDFRARVRKGLSH